MYLLLTGVAAAHRPLGAVSSRWRTTNVIVAGDGRLALPGMTRNWLDGNSIGQLLA